jgi:hypothetical protein
LFLIDHNESFEILWAKRANSDHKHSLNFWFLQRYIKFILKLYSIYLYDRCVARDIKTLRNTGHSIIFTVDDTDISRVEFIIRRCSGVSIARIERKIRYYLFFRLAEFIKYVMKIDSMMKYLRIIFKYQILLKKSVVIMIAYMESLLFLLLLQQQQQQ